MTVLRLLDRGTAIKIIDYESKDFLSKVIESSEHHEDFQISVSGARVRTIWRAIPRFECYESSLVHGNGRTLAILRSGGLGLRHL